MIALVAVDWIRPKGSPNFHEFFSTLANNLLRPPPTVEGIVKGWKPLPMARLLSPTSSLPPSLSLLSADGERFHAGIYASASIVRLYSTGGYVSH